MSWYRAMCCPAWPVCPLGIGTACMATPNGGAQQPAPPARLRGRHSQSAHLEPLKPVPSHPGSQGPLVLLLEDPRIAGPMGHVSLTGPAGTRAPPNSPAAAAEAAIAPSLLPREVDSTPPAVHPDDNGREDANLTGCCRVNASSGLETRQTRLRRPKLRRPPQHRNACHRRGNQQWPVAASPPSETDSLRTCWGSASEASDPEEANHWWSRTHVMRS